MHPSHPIHPSGHPTAMSQKHIAIVSHNALVGIGLQALFLRIVPQGSFFIFSSTEEMLAQHPKPDFLHYFIDSRALLEQVTFYKSVQQRTFVLVQGDTSGQLPDGFRQIDMQVPESEFVKHLLVRMQQGHQQIPNARQKGIMPPKDETKSPLTEREKEVLRLIVKGYLNKEIADKLNVELTTIITHRKNLTQKLGTKSIGALTIFAVMHNIVRVEEI
ncbi:MAG: helix-turn-helix transcriptional regulator [Alloprevotella sp.]|nr:helix-turn-helix transcriptional regulator [Alloprevotella sp.]